MAKNNKGGVGSSNSNSSIQHNSQGASVKNAEKSAGSKDSRDSSVDSRSIIIAGVVILLLLAGIGFLILGLAQSLTSGRVDDAGVAQQTDDLAAAEANTSDNDASAGNDQVFDSGDRGSQGDNPASDSNQSNEQSGGTSSEGAPLDSRVILTSGQTVIRSERGDFKVTENTYRRGNTYKAGDITGDRYQVKKGDTLWQIAQGKYGSGYAWTVINDANGGFPLLKDGTPNNIPVGYNLILPAL